MFTSLLFMPCVIFLFGVFQPEIGKPIEKPITEITAKIGLGKEDSLHHTRQYTSEVATAWFDMLTNLARTKPYGNSQALRIYAYCGVALYESVVPGMPAYQSIFLHLTGKQIPVDKKKDFYWPACANAAIARISARIMQQYPSPDLAPVLALESIWNNAFQAEISIAQLERSNEFGKLVGNIIYEWSRSDGTLNPDGSMAICPPYLPLGKAGNWVPAPPANIPAAGACQGNLRSFIPNLEYSEMLAPPPSYSEINTSSFYLAANDVYQTSRNISTEDLRLVESWRDKAGNYNQSSHTVSFLSDILSHAEVNLEDAAVLFAKQTMCVFDVIIVAARAKYNYAMLRPITYIRNVMGHSSWIAAIPTPPLPSYPGFQGLQSATATILENHFGVNFGVTDSTQTALYGSRQYPSLNSWLKDVARGALLSGAEFRFAIDAGINQGIAMAKLYDTLPFKKPRVKS